LGGDWKFLALSTGIEVTGPKYFCLWCKCPSEDKHICGTWSAINPEKGAGTVTNTLQNEKETYRKILLGLQA